MRDVVGLYLDPPHNAVVFSFDEKSQIQALDRTQPGLPMKKGRCATMTHDYKRHGTTTVFAALNMATGEVVGKTYRKHRHQEVLRFSARSRKDSTQGTRDSHRLGQLRDAQTREGALVDRTQEAHLPYISSRPVRRGSISWNGSLRFLRKSRFVEVSSHRCRTWRSACASTWESYNENPRTLVWTKTVDEIVDKIRRGRTVLSKTL